MTSAREQQQHQHLQPVVPSQHWSARPSHNCSGESGQIQKTGPTLMEKLVPETTVTDEQPFTMVCQVNGPSQTPQQCFGSELHTSTTPLWPTGTQHNPGGPNEVELNAPHAAKNAGAGASPPRLNRGTLCLRSRGRDTPAEPQ